MDYLVHPALQDGKSPFGPDRFMLPDGVTIRVREMNGEDEVALSKVNNVQSGNALPIFLSQIIIDTDEKLEGGRKRYTEDEISEWPSNKKYYAAIMARIHSLGWKLNFNFKFDNETSKLPGGGFPYEEDLRIYTAPLEKWHELLPEQLEKVHPLAIRPYTSSQNTLNLKFGDIEVRLERLSSYGEKLMLNKNQGDLSKKDEFLVRKISVKRPGAPDFMLIESMREFSARQMAEMRAEIQKFDPPFTAPVQLTSPKGTYTEVPVVTLPEFFFPSGLSL